MDWRELIKLIPLVANSVDPRAGQIASAITTLANAEIAKAQQNDPSKTREQVIAEAGADWDLGVSKAKELRQLGHGEG